MSSSTFPALPDFDIARPFSGPTPEAQSIAELAMLICEATFEADHGHLNRLLDALSVGSYRQGLVLARTWRGRKCNPGKHRGRTTQDLLMNYVLCTGRSREFSAEEFTRRLRAAADAVADAAYVRGHADGRAERAVRRSGKHAAVRDEPSSRTSQWNFCVTTAQLGSRDARSPVSFGGGAKPHRR